MENACCAHMRVSYRTRVSRPGLVVEAWWECDSDCGKRFSPDAAPPKELRGVFNPGSASDQVPEPPPSDAAPVEPTEEMVEAVIRDRAKRGRGCGYTPDVEKRQRTMIRRDLRAALTAQKEGK